MAAPGRLEIDTRHGERGRERRGGGGKGWVLFIGGARRQGRKAVVARYFRVLGERGEAGF
ncbi:hypothetical protein E2562_009312 [Oryza meyeriana var. granulata]|uniref:Uncharacterized protein n=1 Tax=Oryza meyeriana var. granulata TaxID=110450 RepID=A0A6G1CG10_9ORYZ|nr:hypothetical protein E2562_009312 [Oryza meyeriana var. granulata]